MASIDKLPLLILIVVVLSIFVQDCRDSSCSADSVNFPFVTNYYNFSRQLVTISPAKIFSVNSIRYVGDFHATQETLICTFLPQAPHSLTDRQTDTQFVLIRTGTC